MQRAQLRKGEITEQEYVDFVKGKIKEGMYADFIVLDTDLVSCTDMEILEAKVLRTFVGGKCVYER